MSDGDPTKRHVYGATCWCGYVPLALRRERTEAKQLNATPWLPRGR